MDTPIPIYALTCAWCVMTFFVCRPDYHGQEYCNDGCRAM